MIAESDYRAILEVKDLKVYFPLRRGVLRRKVGEIKAVDGISFAIKKGSTFGLVGESGCGKTTVARCVVRLYTPTAGRIFFDGKELTQMPEGELREIRKKITIIFQDPYSSLDPRQRIGSIVGEPLIVHAMVRSKKEYYEKVEYLLSLVGLDPGMMNRFPHELSGGQRQRVSIARALASDPLLVVCDEPLSALDVSIQAQIINLLKDLQGINRDLSYLFISHDLAVIRHMCDTTAVMYLGKIVELADTDELFENPLHPYTRALISAVPIPDPYAERKRKRIILSGEVPSPISPPPGCAFHPRCPFALKDCSLDVPVLHEVASGHYVACHLLK